MNTYSSTRFLSIGTKSIGTKPIGKMRCGARRRITTSASVAAAALLLCGIAPSQAKKRTTITELNDSSTSLMQARRARRMMLLLPARVGEDWKATPEFTAAFLRQSDLTIRRLLASSGRYSLLEVRRFNPVLLRAVQDGVATSDDLNTLVTLPTAPNASIILSKMTFGDAPLQTATQPAVIASFVLDKISMTPDSFSVKLSGRLYAADGRTVLRRLAATTTVPYATAGGAISSAATSALSTAANRIAAEFTRLPTENEIVTGEQPLILTPADKATVVTAPTPAEPIKTTGGVLLPGKPIKGASSRPLGDDGVPLSGATTPTAQTPLVTTGVTTIVEVPGAEKFPTSGTETQVGDETETGTVDSTDVTVAPDTSGMATPETTTTGASGADASVLDASVAGTSSGESATPEAAATATTSSDMTGDAGTASGSTPDTSSDSPTSSSEGSVSDTGDSTGTVGATSTDAHAIQRPIPQDDDLAFEY